MISKSYMGTLSLHPWYKFVTAHKLGLSAYTVTKNLLPHIHVLHIVNFVSVLIIQHIIML